MQLAAPTVSGPTLFEFENGTVGESIVYTAYDANPKNWTVTVDGSYYDSASWDGGDITVLLVYLRTTGLITTLPQEFNFEITVYNQAEESASASTTVRVIQDTSPPIIVQPANITYEEGNFGNEIQWNITEANPDFYNITRESNELTSNNTVMESGDWNGLDISINVDGLNASHWYLYTLFVRDTFGYNSSSTVNVTVLPDSTAPLISSPDDVSFEFGDFGYSIEWDLYDSNPKNYTVDGIVEYNDTLYGDTTDLHTFLNVSEPDWSFTEPEGMMVSISLDNLFLGNYTVIITAFDDFNRSTTDSVFVYIYPDVRAPVIDASDDLIYEEGYTGYNISWSADENNPLWYNLTFNGNVLMNGTWNGENFSINVDGLAVGTYIYNMTFSDFFNATSFKVIEVQVTPDAHNPIIAEIEIIQTLASPSTNNLTAQAYVWDLNNIIDITIEWGVGNPEDTGFVPESSNMTLSTINDFFTAELGEYQQGVVVWYRISATDNSSVNNVETTEWKSVVVSSISHQGAPALLYAVVAIFGGLSLLVLIAIYMRTK